MRTTEELLKNRIVRHNKPISRSIYFLQLIGILIPLIMPLWVMLVYEIILFVIYEYLNELYKQSVLSSLKVLAETCQMLNKRI